ncbi:type I restriction endonuclease subunit R, partial [candidate division KSB1 bacterium]|nr:type I restriction endonuclease subunit R [candidate division KSB1 bacterium]
IAKDLVAHFTGRGFQGKAMMICIDKATAVRMYDKVKKYWAEQIRCLRQECAKASGENRLELQSSILEMQDTDMAVVVSQAQNEIADMVEKGLDIRPHRKRMIEEDLETKFKNPDDPFRLVFVCAMWMTGFDVPSCSTLYLDKPMRNHTLMQTIARANRVFPGKVSGLIVDYAGVFRNLEKALAIYGAGDSGEQKPVEEKSALVAALIHALDETVTLCRDCGINLEAIRSADGFDLVGLIDDAVEALMVSEEIKRRYLDLANTVWRFYKAVLPDPEMIKFAIQTRPIKTIADKIRSLTPPADISQVMQQVENLLDRSIATEGYVIRETKSPYGENHLLDLSAVDFEKLAEKFKTGRKRTINEKLKGSVATKLLKMVRLNRTRMDYLEKFQAMIDAYNAGSLNAEEFFRQLVNFARSLDEEEQRTVGEQLNEEELALFDLLTKPSIDMTDKDRAKVKAVSRSLLDTLKKEKLVLDWRKRQQSRAEVRVTIEKLLDEGLPQVYTPELFDQKTVAVFQHIYDAYFGAGKSIYTMAA